MSEKTLIKNQDCALREYLLAQYAGIFDDAAIEAHIRDYVGFVFSDSVAPLVARQILKGGKILDIGCGFGAFVISSRRLGFDAIGVEIAPFEVEYAKRRWEQEMPGTDPSSVYFLGDGHTVPFAENSFDAVTLWNVLEHVPDGLRLLREATRVLKPNGILFIICPNYAAFRQEAHYLVPWWPLLFRKLASIYLRILGKDPRFFETSIFYRTNWEVHHALSQLGMRVSHIEGPLTFDSTEIDLFAQNIKNKIWQPELARSAKLKSLLMLAKKFHIRWMLILGINFIVALRYLGLWSKYKMYNLRLYNPFIESITLSAKKVVR